MCTMTHNDSGHLMKQHSVWLGVTQHTLLKVSIVSLLSGVGYSCFVFTVQLLFQISDYSLASPSR